MNNAQAIVVWVILIALYWTPTAIAVLRKIRGVGQVVVVNLFLGWTGIGWVVALVMSFRTVPPAVEVSR